MRERKHKEIVGRGWSTTAIAISARNNTGHDIVRRTSESQITKRQESAQRRYDPAQDILESHPSIVLPLTRRRNPHATLGIHPIQIQNHQGDKRARNALRSCLRCLGMEGGRGRDTRREKLMPMHGYTECCLRRSAGANFCVTSSAVGTGLGSRVPMR